MFLFFLADFFTNKGGAIKQWKTSSAFMDISKLPDRVSRVQNMFEAIGEVVFYET